MLFKALIREGKTFQIPSAIATGRASGMFTLDQDLARLTALNRITREEALSRAQDPKEYMRYLEAAQQQVRMGQLGTPSSPAGARKDMASSLSAAEKKALN